MKKYTFGTIVLLLFLASLITGCGNGTPPPPDEKGRMEAVATIFPLADMAGRIGGEKVTVTCLLPAGASPHTFEPTTEQVRKSSQADLLLYIGGGLDDWAVKMTAASGRRTILSLFEAAQELGWSPGQELYEISQSGEILNPHLWLDPLVVRDYLCPALAEAMVEADPENEALYRTNLAAYQRELNALDGEIRTSLAALPDKGFISVHAAWEYFAARYRLEQAAVITDFPGQEPSAAWISGLIDLCRKHEVRVVAAEPQLSIAVAELIAHEIDGRVVMLDPLGGEGVPQRDSYLDLMRYNTAVLKDAFSER